MRLCVYHTASAPMLHRHAPGPLWWPEWALIVPGADIRSGISAAARIRRNLCQPSHGLHSRSHATAQHLAPGGWPTSVTPRPGITSGSLPSGRLRSMRTRRFRILLCGRRTQLEIMFLTFGPRLLPSPAGSARSACSPGVRILDLLFRLKQSGNTGGATFNTCCLITWISRAWEAHWCFPVSGMTSFLGPLQRCSGFDPADAVLLATIPSGRTPVAATMIVLSLSSSTLLLRWAVIPVGA